MIEYPRNPKCKRFFKEYGEFTLCVNIGEKGYTLLEHFNERYTAFSYLIKGAGRFGKLFDSNYVDMGEKKVLDFQDYFHEPLAYQATEDFHMIGFNIYDKNIRWEYKLLTPKDKTIIVEKEKNFLVCLNGSVSISGENLNMYDYMKIEANQEYYVHDLGDAEVCIFSEV
jgi:hypothetical protein